MEQPILCPRCRQPVDASRGEATDGSLSCRACGLSFKNPGAAAAPVSCPACGHLFVPESRLVARQVTARPTVLIAEDTAYFRELVRDTLEPRYRTLLAATKDEALHLLRSERVDLLLLDLSLDEQADGRDVLREMQPNSCPVLIFTARDEGETYGQFWDELVALGADDLLIKGMNVEENLLLKVEQLLGEES